LNSLEIIFSSGTIKRPRKVQKLSLTRGPGKLSIKERPFSIFIGSSPPQLCVIIKIKKLKFFQMKHFSKFIAIALMVIGSARSFAQNVDPVDNNKLANGGYDMVAYFTDQKAVKGNAANTVEYNGARYQFASAQHMQLFKSNPEKYLPVCNGYCAWGVAEKGKKVPVNPTTYKIIDGKLYLFFNGDFNGSPFNTLPEWNKNENQLLRQLPVKWSKIQND